MSTPPRRYAIFYADADGERVYEGGGPADEWVEYTVRVPKSWIDAPLDGVQAVVEENPYSSRYVWEGGDFYYRTPGGEVCCTNDLGAILRAYVPWVKHGLCIPENQYERVMAQIRAYDNIPMSIRPRKPWPNEGLTE